MQKYFITSAASTLMATILFAPGHCDDPAASAHGTITDGGDYFDMKSKVGFVAGSLSELPPTGEINVASVIHNAAGTVYTDKKTFEETRTFKLDLHATNNDTTIVINGLNDRQYVPDPIVPTIAGIDVWALGKWDVKDSTFPASEGRGEVEVNMSATAIWSPVDPTSPDLFGQSEAQVKDPFYFHGLAPGETLELESTISAGQALRGIGRGVASKQIFAGTDIPGYESLYQLDITAHEVNSAPTLSVDFVSHPEMKLDNQAIIDEVHQAFALDPVEGAFTLGSDLTIFDGALPIPEGVPFALHLDVSASAEVPQPSVEPPRGGSFIVSPVAITDEGLGADFGVPLTNLIDQSGLSETFVNGETPFSEYVGNGPLATSRRNHEFTFWSTPFTLGGDPPTGELILDFGEEQTFDGLAIWNLTLNEIDICVADTPDGQCEDVGNFTLDEKTGTESAVRPDVLQFDQDHTGRFMRIDIRSLYRPDENSAWFAVANEIAASVVRTGLLGDFNANGELDVNDIDLLTAHIREAGSDLQFDVNLDGSVNLADLDYWVRDLKNTYFGDADLDGEFGSSDLIKVFQAHKYEDNIPGNATWNEGDWDGNGDFETGDLIKAFQDRGYESGPRTQVRIVPEPSAATLLILAAVTFLFASRR